MKKRMIGLLTLASLSFSSGALAQELSMKVRGGHELGETAEQFFAEGQEKDVLSLCAASNFKGFHKLTKREAKKQCDEIADERQRAVSGKRVEYKSAGDPTEFRTDTFTFDGDHLVKVELVYSAPSAEVNYRGREFKDILAGVKGAYGPPTSEKTERVQNAYGLQIILHRDAWVASNAAILITEKPAPDGSTTVVAFTRAEYDRTMAAGDPKAGNPLQ